MIPECKLRRKLKGGIVAVVVCGGVAQIKDAVVLSKHRTLESAHRAASMANAKRGAEVGGVWLLTYEQRAHVEWADEFEDAGGVVP